MTAGQIEAFLNWLSGYEPQAEIVGRRLRLGQFVVYSCVKGPHVDVLKFDTGCSDGSPSPLHVEPVLEACTGYFHQWLASPGDPFLDRLEGIEIWEGHVFQKASLPTGSFIDDGARLMDVPPALLLIANREDEPSLSLRETIEGLGSFIVSAYDDDGYILGISGTPA